VDERDMMPYQKKSAQFLWRLRAFYWERRLAAAETGEASGARFSVLSLKKPSQIV